MLLLLLLRLLLRLLRCSRKKALSGGEGRGGGNFCGAVMPFRACMCGEQEPVGRHQRVAGPVLGVCVCV